MSHAVPPDLETHVDTSGHPKGLRVLFMTELWERFSYYGMRGLLVLFMVDAVHGLNISAGTAGAIYGLYTFGVYALALPGGWVADRLIGKKKAVLYGGILIALGHYSLAIPSMGTFYSGLFLVVLGTGLLKPNVSAIVGDLYPNKDAKRDAGFSIFYSGINIGAFLGPLVCSYLGESARFGWHYGFGAAGVGMTFAVIAYIFGQHTLEGAGDLPPESAQPERMAAARRTFGVALLVFFSIVTGLYFAVNGGALSIETLAESTGLAVGVMALLFFVYVVVFGCRDTTERKRIGVIFLLFLGAAMFWSGFEQAGSSFNLFAADDTNRILFGWEVPAGWLQSVNPLFIILLAPVVGALWVKLGKHNPSIPFKFGIGLVLLGVGFLVLAWGSTFLTAGKVSMNWLVVTYFFHTIGELCLSPVGLSSITKLSPDRMVSQMMGTWFMGTAIGNLIAGLVVGYMEGMDKSGVFSTTAAIVIASGVLFLLFTPLIRKLTVGIK